VIACCYANGGGPSSTALAASILTRMSAVNHLNHLGTSESATLTSAPCRTSAFDRLALSIESFIPPNEISYGVKLPSVSAGLGRFYLRRGADLPQVVQAFPGGNQAPAGPLAPAKTSLSR
jgi:hypothetical protein